MSNVKLYQVCYKPEHFENVPEGMFAFDNLENATPKLCEFPIFNKGYETAVKESAYWGFVSPKFEAKTGIKAKKFIDWIEEDIKTSNKKTNVYFINPTPVNESLYASVINQGDNCHPGLMHIIQEVLTEMNIVVDLSTVWLNSNFFALCNYFVGDNLFWMNYLKFVNSFLEFVEKDPDKKALMYDIGASYGPNKSIPYYTFVVERLFSLFIFFYSNHITVKHYDYTRDELLLKTKLYPEILDEIIALSNIKRAGVELKDQAVLMSWGLYRNRFAAKYPNIFNVE